MWRFQTYGGILIVMAYGLLETKGIVESSRRLPSGEGAIILGLVLLAVVVFIAEPLILKEKRDAQKKKEKDEL